MDATLDIEPLDPPQPCALCHRTLSSGTEDLETEAITICADCKFLFLEDNVTLSPLLDTLSLQDGPQRTPRSRRSRFNSSESIENMFFQQFSSMINQTSSRTTPSGSRRWRRGFSDTESDGFDSVFGESSDVVSYGAYGGDWDASMDGRSFRDGGSDTDIDPMHTGLNPWSSDDDDEWEEVGPGEPTLGSLMARVQPDPFGDMADQEPPHYVGNSGDYYLDARSFEELVERLAETDGTRRGAPPAAASFVKNLERVVVNGADHGGLACAICKDVFSVGGVVNRLPCLHLYHPSCIKPWLSSRNSCPLCRYELPTDDKDYENRKQSGSHGSRVGEMRQIEDDASSQEDEVPQIMNLDGGGRGGGRWLLVAAPLAGLVGIGLALWLGNPGAIRSSGGERGGRSRRWWSLF